MRALGVSTALWQSLNSKLHEKRSNKTNRALSAFRLTLNRTSLACGFQHSVSGLTSPSHKPPSLQSRFTSASGAGFSEPVAGLKLSLSRSFSSLPVDGCLKVLNKGLSEAWFSADGHLQIAPAPPCDLPGFSSFFFLAQLWCCLRGVKRALITSS